MSPRSRIVKLQFRRQSVTLAAFTVTAGAKGGENKRETTRRPRRRKRYFLKGKGSSNKVKTGLRLGDAAGFRELPKHVCRFYTPSRPSFDSLAASYPMDTGNLQPRADHVSPLGYVKNRRFTTFSNYGEKFSA
jgi:hypothetical protein